MIRLENVTKYYLLKGGVKHYVIKDVSLTIPDKKSLAILGPNGAGKSTLLRLIGGAEDPNSGKIISEANISWPLGLKAGFQGSLTGKQNVRFVCEINGLNKSETLAIIEGVENFAELGDFYDMPVKTYSSGMRARLGFGLSISFEFDYYLIDELTSVGDAIFRSKATREFKRIKKRASLIFVSHNLQTIKDACDSALFLRNGTATYYEDIDEGIEAYYDYIILHGSKKEARKLRKEKRLRMRAKKLEVAALKDPEEPTKSRIKSKAKKRAKRRTVKKKVIHRDDTAVETTHNSDTPPK